MCGVAAQFSYRSDRPVNREMLMRIRDYMMPRGPDGAGIWISDGGDVGLAHRRLAIIDLSENGAQPMHSADGAIGISFNGEIYNYRALRTMLEREGFRFRTQTDTEVLLHLYIARGETMLRELRGMYAFAVWDARKKALFLARDPFGIKPLYYADDGRTIRVASQVKALLKGGGVDTAPEAAGHVGFFLWGHVPEPYTLYKGIRALPAGTSLWVDAAGRKHPKQFFDITEELAAASVSLRAITGGEARERLRAALLDSVRHHLIADVPVGVFLSAGLDSTTLAALTREVGVDELRTITLGFEELRGTINDETPLAERMARDYGAVHHTIWVTKEDFLREQQRLLNAMDQPSTDGVNSYFVSKAAAETGIKVALSGLGGDELFGGYPSFRQLPRMVKALGPLRFIPGLGAGFRLVSASILKRFTSPKYAGLLEYGGTYGGAFLLRRGLFMPWELPDLLDDEMVRLGWNDLRTLPSLERLTRRVKSARRKVTALETIWTMRNQLLRDTDWASMAHSIEIRVPLVDHCLLRAVASVRRELTKADMATAPRALLPSAILNRRKTGFTVPVRDWLLQDKPHFAKRGLRDWALNVYAAYGAAT
jgi:asparagine synthase (glutamine-hydrolysing)